MPQLLFGDEVLVFETGSTDGTREWLKTQTNIRSTFFDGKCDFALARNQLVAMSKNDVVAFLDDDCYVDVNWLKRIRRQMLDWDAVGGLVMPNDRTQLPSWWNEEIAWTVGMSSKGVISHRHDSYPATANLAVKRDVLMKFPFQETKHDFRKGNTYLSGREDAHWWLAVRRAGLRLTIDTKLVVWHDVDVSRFKLSAICKRAWIDGYSAWLREPNPAWATDALNVVSHTLIMLPWYLVKPKKHLPELIWAIRQAGLAHAGHYLKLTKLCKSCFHILKSISKKILATCVRHYLRLQRGRFVIPPEPSCVLIVSPAFLGDTVLLQAAVSQLARNLPRTRIEIITRYHSFFNLCPMNVLAFGRDTLEDMSALEAAAKRANIVFVPYWHNMSVEPWRRFFAQKSVTFDCDVGFKQNLDYALARKLVPKRFTRNEAINLSMLLHQWPEKYPLEPPKIVADTDLRQKLLAEYPVLGGLHSYAMIQVDTAQNMKLWPAERWIVLGEVLLRHGLNLAIVSAEANSDAAVKFIEKFTARYVVDLGGCSMRELVALISGAAIAVGGCSGPKHLAFALRVPTFTVYGPMKPDRWGDLGEEDIHGGIVSPVPYLTGREMAGLQDNQHMLQVDATDAAMALEKHLLALKNRTAV